MLLLSIDAVPSCSFTFTVHIKCKRFICLLSQTVYSPSNRFLSDVDIFILESWSTKNRVWFLFNTCSKCLDLIFSRGQITGVQLFGRFMSGSKSGELRNPIKRTRLTIYIWKPDSSMAGRITTKNKIFSR